MGLAEAIYSALERAEPHAPPRFHLGASTLGHPCTRYVWYVYNQAACPPIDGRTLRLFRRGRMEEATVVADLRAAGYEVSTGPRKGRQWAYRSADGKWGGSIDGGIKIDGEWHLLEIKTANQRNYNALAKNGIRKEKEQHWVQIQCYLRWSGLRRALYLVVNKNDDNIYTEIVGYNPEEAERIEDRARAIVAAVEPPERISNRPDWYQCRTCQYASICHG